MFKPLRSSLVIMIVSLVVMAGCEKNDTAEESVSPLVATPAASPATAAVPTPSPELSASLNAIQTYGNFETAGVDIKLKTLLTTETATDNTTVTTKPEYALPTPVRTVKVADQTQLDAAILASLPGDHILLDPKGTYSGLLISTHSGTAEHPILIGSQTSEKAVFSGGISINNSDYVTITSLEIHALSLNSCSYGVVVNNYIHDGNSAKDNYDAEVYISHSEKSNFPGVGGHLIMNNIIGDDVHDPIDESHGILKSYDNSNGRTFSGIKGRYNPGTFNTFRGNIVYGLGDGISITGDEGSPEIGPNDPDL